MPSVWEQISDNVSLVTLPDVYLRLKAVLDDPNSCMADVADVVGNDPALTARLLRIVNSAYFGLAAEIDTVNRAVVEIEPFLGAEPHEALGVLEAAGHEGLGEPQIQGDPFEADAALLHRGSGHGQGEERQGPCGCCPGGRRSSGSKPHAVGPCGGGAPRIAQALLVIEASDPSRSLRSDPAVHRRRLGQPITPDEAVIP